MNSLAAAHMAASARHPRPRVVLTNHLARSGCALVNTQRPGEAALMARVVASKAMAGSNVATTLAFGLVLAFIGTLFVACCATSVAYMVYYLGLFGRPGDTGGSRLAAGAPTGVGHAQGRGGGAGLPPRQDR